jgi:outer membrane protein
MRRWLFAVLCVGAMGSAVAADLLAVYQRALDTDPLWRQATATRLAIHETKTQAVLNLLPLDVSANKNFIGIGSVQIKTPAYLAAGLTVNLFNWDNWVALKAADATVAQSEANYQAAAQSLIQRVSQQYFAVLAAQDTLTAEQSAYESVQTQLDQAEQRYQSRPDRDHRCGGGARLARQHCGGRDRGQARAGNAGRPVAGHHQ